MVPFLAQAPANPTVFGVSGYSGAGTKPSPKNDVNVLTNNLLAYSLTDHIHEKEISAQLGREIAFIPHVAVWFQGIHHTINIPLNKTMTSRDIRQLYQDRYAGEKLVKVVGEAPLVKSISGKHGVEIGEPVRVDRDLGGGWSEFSSHTSSVPRTVVCFARVVLFLVSPSVSPLLRFPSTNLRSPHPPSVVVSSLCNNGRL